MKKTILELAIEEGIQLEISGNLYKTCCPFHNEKTASCFFYPDTNSFYCFGCGIGGDIIEFVKRIKNISYTEAIKKLNLEQDYFSLQQLKSKLQSESSLEISSNLSSWYLLGNKLLYSKKLYISKESKLLDQYYETNDIIAIKILIHNLNNPTFLSKP